MKPLYTVIILIILIIINVFIFAWIYDVENGTFNEGLYLAVQVQTLVGLSDASRHSDLRTWITIQSIIAYVLNLLLVTFISLIFLKN